MSPLVVEFGFWSPLLDSISASAKVIDILDDKEALKIGDQGRVRFRFCHRPEMVRVGQSVVLRQGSMQAVGRVARVYSDDESDYEVCISYFFNNP